MKEGNNCSIFTSEPPCSSKNSSRLPVMKSGKLSDGMIKGIIKNKAIPVAGVIEKIKSVFLGYLIDNNHDNVAGINASAT